MRIREAEFTGSSTDYKKCPANTIPEIAFVGRSNVGKSSLINALVGRKNLAKTSTKPGKTRLINHFHINKEWFLVDLPGYGWASVSKELKFKWGKMTGDYILNRRNLLCVFSLIDSRLEPQQIDLDFVNWLGENGVPFVLVFTKSDKISKSKVIENVKRFQMSMLKDWRDLPPYFISSAKKGTGNKEILFYIDQILKSIK